MTQPAGLASLNRGSSRELYTVYSRGQLGSIWQKKSHPQPFFSQCNWATLYYYNLIVYSTCCCSTVKFSFSTGPVQAWVFSALYVDRLDLYLKLYKLNYQIFRTTAKNNICEMGGFWGRSPRFESGISRNDPIMRCRIVVLLSRKSQDWEGNLKPEAKKISNKH